MIKHEIRSVTNSKVIAHFLCTLSEDGLRCGIDLDLTVEICSGHPFDNQNLQGKIL